MGHVLQYPTLIDSLFTSDNTVFEQQAMNKQRNKTSTSSARGSQERQSSVEDNELVTKLPSLSSPRTMIALGVVLVSKSLLEDYLIIFHNNFIPRRHLLRCISFGLRMRSTKRPTLLNLAPPIF